MLDKLFLLIENIKSIPARIRLYNNTGYWSMKFVYLASLINTDEATEEEQQAILTGIAKYYNKGDMIYDNLYQGLFNLYVFDLLSKAYQEEDKTKAWQYMREAMEYCNNPNNNVFNNLYMAVADTLTLRFRKNDSN